MKEEVERKGRKENGKKWVRMVEMSGKEGAKGRRRRKMEEKKGRRSGMNKKKGKITRWRIAERDGNGQ